MVFLINVHRRKPHIRNTVYNIFYQKINNVMYNEQANMRYSFKAMYALILIDKTGI